MPYDGEIRSVDGRKDRYNAKKGAWETNVGGGSVSSGFKAPSGVNAASEAAKFKARNQAEAIESAKKPSAGPAPSSVISPLGKAAEEAAKKRKKKEE